MKFNKFTSHMIFLISTVFLSVISDLLKGSYGMAVMDSLACGLWVYNYFYVLYIIKDSGEEYYGAKLLKFMKIICTVCMLLYLPCTFLFINVVAGVIVSLMIIYTLWEIFHSEGDLVAQIRGWFGK